jgi:membrane-anchored glycerophosphoryl diester phosphodiesterase (GDPDase)
VAALVGVAWLVYAAFMGTRLIVAPAALVLEHLSVRDAMRRSWGLVRRDTWRVFGIVLLTQVLIGIVGAVASAPFALGSFALSFLGDGSVAVAAGAAVLLALGQTLTATLTYPFTAGVYGLLYADRRMRAEAFDLALQTAAARPGTVPIDDLWQPQHTATLQQ